MADPAKTEKATPKRKQEARERGQVVRSIEINSVVILLATLLTFRYAGPYIINSLALLMVFAYQNIGMSLGMENVYSFGIFYMWQVFKILAPVLAVVLFVGLTVNYFQVGVLFSLKPLIPKMNNINPTTGLQRLFSRRSAVELIKALLKLLIIGWIGYGGS